MSERRTETTTAGPGIPCHERSPEDLHAVADVRISHMTEAPATRDGEVRPETWRCEVCRATVMGHAKHACIRRAPASATLAVGDEVRLTRVGKITSWTGAATAPGHRTAGVSWGDDHGTEWLHESRIQRVWISASTQSDADRARQIAINFMQEHVERLDLPIATAATLRDRLAEWFAGAYEAERRRSASDSSDVERRLRTEVESLKVQLDLTKTIATEKANALAAARERLELLRRDASGAPRSSNASPDDGSQRPRPIANDELRACYGCFRCLDAPEHGINNPTLSRMFCCPACGNKRCPRATDHRFACTGSNEEGQPGSRYGCTWDDMHEAVQRTGSAPYTESGPAAPAPALTNENVIATALRIVFDEVGNACAAVEVEASDPFAQSAARECLRRITKIRTSSLHEATPCASDDPKGDE